MAEFPRVHWKTIDGKEVPFVEPQHFSGEGDEVVRTGDKNPLPTKDSEVLTALQSIKEENEEIKQTQSEILERLDGEFDTRLTGSNVEDGLPVKSVGNRVEEIQLLDRKVRDEFTQVFETNVDPQIKQAIIILRIYGVTGTFDDGEGYRSRVRKHTRSSFQAYDVAEADFITSSGNQSGNLFTIDPTFNSKSFDSANKYQLVQDTLFPSYRFMLSVSGTFEEGEGVDCDAVAYYVY